VGLTYQEGSRDSVKNYPVAVLLGFHPVVCSTAEPTTSPNDS